MRTGCGSMSGVTRRRALLAGVLAAAVVALIAVRAGHQGRDSARDTSDRQRSSSARDERSTPDNEPQGSALLQLLVVDSEGRPIPRATVLDLRTDQTGLCAVTLEPDRDHVLDVQHASFGPAQIRLEPLAPGARVERVVRLYSGLPLEVRVVHPESQVAIQGAHVQLGSVGARGFVQRLARGVLQ